MSDGADYAELAPGTHLGRYRVERRLGAGAMGAVYLASHTGLNKRVVVKALHSHYARNAEARLRFVREGEAAARISHPHVVDVTDVGVEGAIPYLVMEFLDGESLGHLIDHQGAFSPDRAVDLMLPVIDAVHAAHVAGVIHRDLKPDNLFIVHTATGDIHPKVLDFGISRVVDESARPARTGTAALLGTPAYMSPEQIESARDVDAASDQYALGVILYECLTGTQAFPGDGVYAVLKRVGDGQFERPRSLRPEIDPRLEAVVMRSMARDRAARFSSLRAFGTALLPFASPRARMIWGTTFDPPTDHGPSDTRLEFANAPPSIGEADTLFHSVQEREPTTIPLAARRRRTRRATAGVAVLGAVALSAAGLFLLGRAESPQRHAPVAAIAPTVTVITPLARPEPPAVPVVAPTPVVVPAPVVAPAAIRDAGVAVVVAPAGPTAARPGHPHSSRRQRTLVPDLPP